MEEVEYFNEEEMAEAVEIEDFLCSYRYLTEDEQAQFDDLALVLEIDIFEYNEEDGVCYSG